MVVGYSGGRLYIYLPKGQCFLNTTCPKDFHKSKKIFKKQKGQLMAVFFGRKDMEYDYYKVYPEVDGAYKEKIVCGDIYEVQSTVRWIREQEEYSGYIVIGHIRENKEDNIVAREHFSRGRVRK